MYLLNALHLKQFYASDLGIKVTQQLKQSLHKLWPANDEEAQLAIGYPIKLWSEENVPPKLVVLMPAEQGAVSWPRKKLGANKTFVAHGSEIPLASNSINRLVLIHTLEFTPHINLLLKEAYRVLVPNGRLMLVAPNRMGLWARSEKSPFGYGRPFSIKELRSLLQDTDYTFRRHKTLMFMPPTHNNLALLLFSTIELLGQLFVPMCGGVHMIEAEKQIYAGVMQPIRKAVRSAAPVQPITANTSASRDWHW